MHLSLRHCDRNSLNHWVCYPLLHRPSVWEIWCGVRYLYNVVCKGGKQNMFEPANMQSKPQCQQGEILLSDMTSIITTIWLRKHYSTSFTYHKNFEVYVPKEIEQSNLCNCG